MEERNVTPEFILEAIKFRLKKEAEKLIEQAAKDLMARTPEIVAGVVVDLMKMVSFQDIREHTVFTIKKAAPTT